MKTPTTTLLLVLSITIAQAEEQRIIRDANGNVAGRAVTNSTGTVFYDAMGRNTGRSTTNSQGTTTFYDRMGRTTGTVSGRK